MTERVDTARAPSGLVFDVLLNGHYSLRQNGRTSLVNHGDGMLIHTQMPFLAISPVAIASRSVVLPEMMLKACVGNIDRLAGKALSAEMGELRLLAAYLRSMDPFGGSGDHALKAMVGRHAAELVLAAVARSLRLDDPTEGRGVKAARLAEVKRLIEKDLGQPTLNAVRVARQIGVTERYVQKLIEETGTTFSGYVMEKRLQKAREILAEDRFPQLSVREIGWSLGFSEASHFTRVFRQRFGETPTSVRGSERHGIYD
jgi:AraC-like DNA-binding protein